MSKKGTKASSEVRITGDGNIVSDESATRTIRTTLSGSVEGPVHTGSGNIRLGEYPDIYSPLRDQVQQLRRREGSLESYVPVLKQLTNYFLRTLPSGLDNTLILETESLLNELYVRAYEDAWNRHLIDGIQEALALSSQLSYVIRRHSSGRYEVSFYKNAKKLGERLDVITRIAELLRKD